MQNYRLCIVFGVDTKQEEKKIIFLKDFNALITFISVKKNNEVSFLWILFWPWNFWSRPVNILLFVDQMR